MKIVCGFFLVVTLSVVALSIADMPSADNLPLVRCVK